MNLIFASHNLHKIEEIRKILPEGFELLSLTDIGVLKEIPETGTTIEENALLKARFLKEEKNNACFADDTGLIIPALNGEPGVYSARYAGEAKNPDSNMELVLQKLHGNPNRSAHFKTVIALCVEEKEYLFEGKVNGTILAEKRGTNGFGYDPIFQPEGYEKSFAEMSAEEKNNLSHRAIALKKMMAFLKENS